MSQGLWPVVTVEDLAVKAVTVKTSHIGCDHDCVSLDAVAQIVRDSETVTQILRDSDSVKHCEIQ